jgi:hypothetical protein
VQTVDLLTLAARNPTAPALEIRCNFGVFAGRDATPAELDELARTLLEIVQDVAVVSEQRREVGRTSEAALHQVRIELAAVDLPADEEAVEQVVGRLVQATERWAEACIAERHLEP